MSFARLILGLPLLIALSADACAQGNEDVIYGKPQHARHFAGTVVDPRGLAVDYATVELRSPKDHHVLASNFADGRGFFSFDDKKYGKSVEIRISKKGYNPSLYTAVLKPFADEHMKLVLHPAN